MMKKLLFLLALLPFFTECKSEAPGEPANDAGTPYAGATPKYLVFWDNEKQLHGVMDTSGKIIIEPRWVDTPMMAFHDRVWGYNEETGQHELFTIAPSPKKLGSHIQASSFVEEIAPVCDTNGYIQFVDTDNKVRFTLKELEGKPVNFVRNFQEGICIVQTRDGMMGAIDKNGKTVIKPEYTLMSDPCNGMLLVCEDKYNKEVIESIVMDEYDGGGISCDVTMQVIDLRGKKLGEIDMRKYSMFSLELFDGYLRVNLPEEKDYREAILDIHGNVVAEMDDNSFIQTIHDSLLVYSLYSANDEGYSYHAKDLATGQEISLPQGSAYVELAGHGWIYCGSDEEGYQLVNRDGRKIEGKKFAYCSQFDGGILIATYTDGQGGALIDVEGNIICEFPKNVSPIFSYSYETVSSGYVDVDALVEELQLQKDGFMGITLQNDVVQIDKVIRDQIMKYGTGTPLHPEYETEESRNVHCAMDVGDATAEVGMHFETPFVAPSSSEDEGNVLMKGARPHFMGICFNLGYTDMRGNTRRLLEALKAKVRTLGTVEEEGKNGLLVKTGDDKGILVAFDGYNVVLLVGAYEGVNYGMEMFDSDEEDDSDYKDFFMNYICAEG